MQCVADIRHMLFAVSVPDCCAGVPVHVACGPSFTPEQLRATLSSVPAVSVTLHESLLLQTSEFAADLMSALIISASTLEALHNLPLVDLQDSLYGGLLGFTRLRTLTLLHTPPDWSLGLYATDLPSGLEDLRMEAVNPYNIQPPPSELPHFVAFARLQNLRTITLTSDTPLQTRPVDEGQLRQYYLPQSLEVRVAGRLLLPAGWPACVRNALAITAPVVARADHHTACTS